MPLVPASALVALQVRPLTLRPRIHLLMTSWMIHRLRAESVLWNCVPLVTLLLLLAFALPFLIFRRRRRSSRPHPLLMMNSPRILSALKTRIHNFLHLAVSRLRLSLYMRLATDLKF